MDALRRTSSIIWKRDENLFPSNLRCSMRLKQKRLKFVSELNKLLAKVGNCTIMFAGCWQELLNFKYIFRCSTESFWSDWSSIADWTPRICCFTLCSAWIDCKFAASLTVAVCCRILMDFVRNSSPLTFLKRHDFQLFFPAVNFFNSFFWWFLKTETIAVVKCLSLAVLQFC